MTRVLSQDEIDALLSVAVGTRRTRQKGGGPAGPVVRYDFRRPDRVSKEQMHALQFLHERAARNLSTSLSAYLRTSITLQVASVEQVAYRDFLGTLADPTAFYALDIAPFDEPGALEINPVVAFSLIDRMLGGTGQAEPMARPLSEIEQNVVDEIVKVLLDGLGEAWRGVAGLSFRVRGRETRPQMLQVAASNEVVCTVTFDVKVGDVVGAVNLSLPTNVVESAGAQFSGSWQRQRRDLTPTERAWLDANLARMPVPVVPLIRTRLKAGAVLALRPGEVVALPLSADSPLDVHVSGARKLTGRLASDRGRLMVQVERRSQSTGALVSGAV